MENLPRPEAEKYISILIRENNNNRCFDCAAYNPSWISLKYGVIVCTQCAALHRAAGNHPKSTLLDAFTLSDLKRVKHGGNFIHGEKDFKKRYEKLEKLPMQIDKLVEEDEENEIKNETKIEFKSGGEKKKEFEKFGKKIESKDFKNKRKNLTTETKTVEKPKEEIFEKPGVVNKREIKIERNKYKIGKVDVKRFGFGVNKIEKDEDE